MNSWPPVLDLLIAALAGMAIGIERERSGHTAGPDARFAGIRTFAFIGAIGGIAGWLGTLGYREVAAVLVAAVALFIVAAYVTAMRRPAATSDSTTEVSALVALALGYTAGIGQAAIAGGAAVIVVLLLAEKSALQRAIARVDGVELRAALLFAVMALVVLPLLPDRAFGPYDAVRPRSLWIVVLLFSGLNFIGYIARRLIGETRGLAVTGLLGGMISSTAVSLHFSRRSQRTPEHAVALAYGVIAACIMLLPRITLVSALLQPGLLAPLVWRLAPAFLMGAALVGYILWRGAPGDGAPAVDPTHNGTPANPLAFWTSIQMAVALQAVLLIMAWVNDRVGTAGVLPSAAILGLTDMDALVLAMTRLAADATQRTLAANAIVVGVIANTVLKTTLVLVLGHARYRGRAGGGLVLLGLATAAGLWLGSWLDAP